MPTGQVGRRADWRSPLRTSTRPLLASPRWGRGASRDRGWRRAPALASNCMSIADVRRQTLHAPPVLEGARNSGPATVVPRQPTLLAGQQPATSSAVGNGNLLVGRRPSVVAFNLLNIATRAVGRHWSGPCSVEPRSPRPGHRASTKLNLPRPRLSTLTWSAASLARHALPQPQSGEKSSAKYSWVVRLL